MGRDDRIAALSVSVSQAEFGEIVGISQPAVSGHVAKGALSANGTLLEWLREYCDQLRHEAAGHKSSDGSDLTRERVLTERVDRELKLLTLQEKIGRLVPVDEVGPQMIAMVVAARTELQTMADKICSDIRTLHEIEIDPELVNGHVDDALTHLAAYQPDADGNDQGDHNGLGSATQTDDGAMGQSIPVPVA